MVCFSSDLLTRNDDRRDKPGLNRWARLSFCVLLMKGRDSCLCFQEHWHVNLKKVGGSSELLYPNLFDQESWLKNLRIRCSLLRLPVIFRGSESSYTMYFDDLGALKKVEIHFWGGGKHRVVVIPFPPVTPKCSVIKFQGKFWVLFQQIIVFHLKFSKSELTWKTTKSIDSKGSGVLKSW